MPTTSMPKIDPFPPFRPPSDVYARGALSEFIAACDLIRQDFEVFLNIDNTALCDLVVRRGSETFFVEVKTAWRGKFTQNANLKNKRADILAPVNIEQNTVTYRRLAGGKFYPTLTEAFD